MCTGTCGVSFLLPSCEFWGWNSAPQVLQRAPLSTKPSCQPRFPFTVVIPHRVTLVFRTVSPLSWGRVLVQMMTNTTLTHRQYFTLGVAEAQNPC